MLLLSLGVLLSQKAAERVVNGWVSIFGNVLENHHTIKAARLAP